MSEAARTEHGAMNANPEEAGASTGPFERLTGRMRQPIWGRIFAVSLSVGALLAGIATYAALTGAPPIGDSPDLVLILLNVDLALLLLLMVVVARRIVAVWSERRRGSAGSRLHVKLVVLFGLVSVVPAIIVAVFSLLFFNFGVESWFSDRVRTALKESVAAAETYLYEHKQNIRADVLAMARDLNLDAPLLVNNPRRFSQALSLQATVRELTEAIVFDGSGQVLARSGMTYLLEFEPIPKDAIETARAGEVAILTSEYDDRVRALVRLDGLVDAFLYVGRFVDPVVLGHMKRTKSAVAQFEKLEIERADLQISFALIFVVVGLLLLLAAVWVGLMFATQLSRPISALITATEKVRAGDFSVRVPENLASDEVGSLSRAFNRMTNELETSRRELIEANLQLDERRRFTEAVLAGVSAGVIGLDENGIINLPNRSASELLGFEVDEVVGHPLAEVVPEMAELLERARRERRDRPIDGEIRIKRGSETRTFVVRVATEWEENEIKGFVVTFDDVSELLTAQRKAAWADVARRIAHEIKNPLTPIQLSAERLKRKYENAIADDRETFAICTDTIIRHVEDIGRMVDEFSSFARMPAPVMRIENLSDLCRQMVFLQRNGHPDIEFVTELPEEPIYLRCDGRQIGQALTNLLQNAIEAISGREGSGLPPGRVVVRLRHADDRTVIEVEDNGKGLPAEERERLTDPYVTTRKSGTGLGLAIVKKIMEDHGGRLVLEDAPERGACVRLELYGVPIRPEDREADVGEPTKAAAHGA